MGIEAAEALELLVNAYIHRALLSPEDLLEVSQGFGGLELAMLKPGRTGRRALARLIASKVLDAGWRYDVIDESTYDEPNVRIVITGRS